MDSGPLARQPADVVVGNERGGSQTASVCSPIHPQRAALKRAAISCGELLLSLEGKDMNYRQCGT